MAVLLLIQSVFVFVPNHSALAQTGLVNTDRLNLRSGPGTSYSSVSMLSTNTKVTINGSQYGTDGYLWYQVTTGSLSGYLRSDFVNLDVTYSASDADFEAYMTQQGFPDSYKNALRGLHQKYPNWVFVAQHTGLDWNTVIAEETKIGRNLVYTDSISSWKSMAEGAFDWAGNYWPGFDGSCWVAASEEIIRHYMDPRNFLTDPYIFQFQSQVYDPAIQTREGLAGMVQGTFLEGYPGQTKSGTSTTGPSGSSSSGSSSYGPGYNSGSSSSSSYGPSLSSRLSDTLRKLTGSLDAYAAWSKAEGIWYYTDDSGKLYVSGWHWVDGNKDGVSECYYFDANGCMAANTTVDGYTVNSDGQWTVDGVIQTQGSASSSSAKSYVDLIMEAATQSKVSPYVLAAMIIQEQGTQGTSPLISGNYSSYPGYYNFYNIGAYEHNGMSAVEAGLKYASESGSANRPWNTVEKGIIGGAIAYGANYTDAGQDTFYLKKFNVQGSHSYDHQYSTNVVAAAEEGSQISDAYTSEIKNSALVFKIPVYLNMPDSPQELPTKKGNPNSKLSSLSVDGFTLTPTFHMNTSEYTLIVDGSVSSVNVSAATIDSKATVQGTGYHELSTGLNQITVTVTAENGDTRSYSLSITRKEGGQTASATGPVTGSGSSTGPGSVTGPGTQSSGSSEISISGSETTSSGTDSGYDSTVIISGPPG